MNKPILHLIGLFHTIPNHDYDHCAFTGKVLRFSKMMQAKGYHVIEYSNGESISEAKTKVQILTKDELMSFTKTVDTVISGINSIGSPQWAEFNERLKVEMKKRVKKGDIICYPFGNAHNEIFQMFPEAYHVETGIGYQANNFGAFQIYETNAWMHYHQGKENRSGKHYEWVVPNYYDIDLWEPKYTKGDYFLYFGRVVEEKGLYIVKEIAERLNEPVRVVGSGNLELFQGKNMILEGPIVGSKERSDLLRNAKAVIMPTLYTEPFGGVTIEAALCGTPTISTSYGSFTETIIDGVTGFRCYTLGDFLAALEKVETLDRKFISDNARAKYNLDTVGDMYDKIFMQISDLGKKGWYSEHSHRIK